MKFIGLLIDKNAMKDRYEPLFIPLMSGDEFDSPSFSKNLSKKVFESYKKASING